MWFSAPARVALGLVFLVLAQHVRCAFHELHDRSEERIVSSTIALDDLLEQCECPTFVTILHVRHGFTR